MKNLVYIAFILMLGIIGLESFTPLRVMRRDGTEPGYTGSPGDSNKSCTTCHGGVATTREGWITSDIPAEGYTPGKKYTIRATNTSMGSTRFGFEVSPQNLSGALLGTMVVTDTLRTKLVGDNKYITYKADGVDGVDSNWWVFDWIAPAAGTGEVVFYGAFNANPGHKGGDGTTLSTLKVQEYGTTGLKSVEGNISNLSIYPNPTHGAARIGFTLKKAAFVTITVTDLNGKQEMNVYEGRLHGVVDKTIDVSSVPQGIYLLQIKVDGKSVSQKLQILR